MANAFKGVVNLDIRDSIPDWSPYEQPKAAAGTPNILYIVLDDVGFGALGCYGGPIDRVAEVSSYLAEVTESEFGVRYDAMPLDDRNPEYGPDERRYAWGWLQEVADFFQRAARENHHVVFTVRF